MGVWARMVWDFKLMANWAFMFVFYLEKTKILSETHLPPMADKKFRNTENQGRGGEKRVNCER